MVISHRHKYLYFVIPKCASATLRQSLKPYTDIGYPVSVNEQHMTMAGFLGSEDAELFDDYFKFTFVRNPYDRLYSGYVQDRHAAEVSPRWATVKKPIFDQIGDDFNRYMQEYVVKAERETAWNWICFCPMTAFSHQKGRYRLDWCGRVEYFDADLAVLAEKLGIGLEKASDVNVNVAPKSSLKYLSKYDRQTIQLVNHLYADDFSIFGYQKQNPMDFPVSRTRGA